MHGVREFSYRNYPLLRRSLVQFQCGDERVHKEDNSRGRIYLGIVVVFFALCFGMVRLFEKI